MFGLFRRKKEMPETGRWIVFNQGDGLEFAECEKCGCECDPQPALPMGYFDHCPKCGRLMIGTITAEEVDTAEGA